MRQFKLTKNECYCSLNDFYATIARKLGSDITKVNFNSRKICVSELVMEELMMYMRDQGMGVESASMAWACFGPKQTIVAPGELIVQIESGFIVKGDQIASKCRKPKKNPAKMASSKDIKHKAPVNNMEQVHTYFGIKPYKSKK